MIGRCLSLLVVAGAAVGAGPGSLIVHGTPPRVRYDDHRVVQVLIEAPADLDRMRAMGARLFGERFGIGPVDYLVSPAAFAALRGSGIVHRVLLDDVQERIEAERARLAAAGAGGVAGGGWFLDFKDYDAINARLDEIAAARPDLASTLTLGPSLEGRPIRGLRISGPGTDKPAVLVNACQHAREWIAPMVATYVADRLVGEYDVDARIRELVDAVEIFVVPVVNPDGYVHSWGPDRLWRKNRRDNGDGSFGVDLNRNWSVGFGDPIGSSPLPNADSYHGPAAFSEPETQALRDFYLAHPNLVANIDFHSYSQLVLWPWSHTSDSPPDATVLDTVGAQMSASILSVHGQSYTNQQAIELYPAAGTAIDWAYGERGVFSYTIELRPWLANPGFLLPPDEIVPTAEENLPAVLDLIEFAPRGVLFAFPDGLPSVIESGTGATVLVQMTPVRAGLVPGSARLFARVGPDAAFEQSVLADLGGGLFEATLPAAPCGSEVHYYLQVETDDQAVHSSPDGVPASLHEALALELEVVFEDDFESDLGWSVSDDAGLVDGTWDRGVPVPQDECDRGNPGRDADGSGQCFLTDNSAAGGCNSDVDGGTTTLTSPVMDASDPDAVLSYWRWYSNSCCADPFNDTFLVEVSDDAGATWVTLELVGPGGGEVSGGWIQRAYRVSEIAGLANTAQFRIRFHASDLPAGSVVEAAVDGVRLRSEFCAPGEACPWDLDGSGLVDTADLLALLSQWGAGPDGPPDFDGDGSVDAVDFLSLLGHWGPCPR